MNVMKENEYEHLTNYIKIFYLIMEIIFPKIKLIIKVQFIYN